MSDVWTIGELLVEVMRPGSGIGLRSPGPFIGPFPSGAPGIFIDTVSRLGRSAAIISGVGDDEFGRCILDRLQCDGVDTSHVQVFPHKSTGVAFVSYNHDGSRDFIFHWDGTPAVLATAPSRDSVTSARVLHVMGCSLMANAEFRAQVFKTAELFVSLGAELTFDPNIRFELLAEDGLDDVLGPIMQRCSILFPGEHELQVITGRTRTSEAVEAAFDRYPLRLIVMKQGSRGCTVFERDGRVEVPGFAVDEVDPTGAGDCFDAGYICGELEGLDPESAAVQACAAGALNAQAFGPMEGSISPASVTALVRVGARRTRE